MRLVLALCLCLANLQGGPTSGPIQDRAAQAARIATAEMEIQGAPGMVLYVLHGDQPIIARGFGREAFDRPDPVTIDSRFMYNSISKQFLAAAVLKLAEAGQLSIEDPVALHLPDWVHLPAELTLRHLLNHTSGVREVFVQPALTELFEQPGTSWADFAAMAARETPFDFPPASRWSYSNVNYLMLQLVVERRTGEPLADALKAMFFEPLELSSVAPCASPGERRGEMRGHVTRKNALAGHPPEPAYLFLGSGGFCGSAPDLARWTRALVNGRVVSPSSVALMSARTPLPGGRGADYGFAMALVEPDGIRRIGHGGYGGGYSAQAAYYPDFDLTIVTVLNHFVHPERIERRVARNLLSLPTRSVEDLPMSAAERQDFVGAFDVGIKGWHPRVEARGDRLWFVLPGPPIELPLRRTAPDILVGADDQDSYVLTFNPDRSEMQLLGMGLMTWYGHRVGAEN